MSDLTLYFPFDHSFSPFSCHLGEKNLHILQDVSKLFPIVSVSRDRKKRGKKTWRSSHAEAADAFVIFKSVSSG